MIRREHEHLVQYFSEGNGSLLESVMRDQLGFDSSKFPVDIFPEISSVGETTVLKFQGPSVLQGKYDSNLHVLREELLEKSTTRPLLIDQELISLSIFDGYLVDWTYVYRYSGPGFDCPGVLQHFCLELPSGMCPMIKSVDLTREIIDNVGDLRFASVLLWPDAEKEIAQLAGLPADALVWLTIVPGHILVTKGSYVIRELDQGNLQKIGMNARFEDEEDKMVVRVTEGDRTIVLELGKKLKSDYPRLMFEKLEPITLVEASPQNWRMTSFGRELSNN